ncbi:VOC family protein [Arthrobacter sp. MMS18-M83]|uniref:VOC family protein n=1 Tax=Arthrobacter sp. MMS18-M83 TaxID=2996261 RepID=UPI00227C32F7|nr:VOC family protein [Arthrobacter sp. MMS18-M83]WAH95253.1 VOC family protein [Arthrobacter sp. MMS18-M83]
MPVRNESWPEGTPNWVDAQVDDVKAAADFYSRLFGWVIQDAGPEAGGYHMAFLGGSPVAGIGPKPENAGPLPSVWSTYLAVDDADATAAKITEAGGQLMMPPFDVMDQGRMSVAFDTAGAAFGIWQSTGHHGIGRYNEPGAVCWNELHTRGYQPAREFYASVFGFSYTDIGDGSEFVYSTFERPKDGQTVGGISHDTNLPDGVPSYWLTWFQVQDPDATLEAAAALGAATLFPPTDSPFGRMAILQGPQGETFGIINPPAQAGTTQES